MIFRIFGGLYLLLFAIEILEIGSVGNFILGIMAVVAGVALLAGK